MLEQAAVTAADRPQDSDAGDYVVWQHRFRPFRIRLKPGIDAALQAHALAAERSHPSCEIGGLLFGRIETHGPEACITVTETVFVHSKGRFFNSRGNDQTALVDALRQSADAASKPIGYFRSDLRDQFALTPEDKQFVINNLPIPHSVSLLIRPDQSGVCMLGVFLWKNNRIQNEFADFDIPLFSSEAQRSEEPPAAVSVSLRREPIPATLESRRPARGLVRALIGATICLSALVIVLLLFISRRPSSQPSAQSAVQPAAPATTLVLQSAHRQAPGTGGLGLEVSRPAPDQLNVSWDRQLPPNARRGVLDILDGSKHRSLSLDVAQLRLGRLTYFSSGADISFRLDVQLAKGSPVSEYIRVLGTDTGTNVSNLPPQPAEVVSEPARLQANSKAIPSVKAAPAFRESHNVVAAALPETAPDVPNFQPELASALPVPQAPPAMTAPAVTAPAITPAAITPRPPSESPAGDSGLNPPQPLQRVMPRIHDIYPNGLPTASRIAVDVVVNSAGKVTKASTSARFGLLSDACVTAAKQWRFVPAMKNKQPVAGQYQVVFVFDARK